MVADDAGTHWYQMMLILIGTSIITFQLVLKAAFVFHIKAVNSRQCPNGILSKKIEIKSFLNWWNIPELIEV